MNKILILGIIQFLVVFVLSRNLPSFINLCKRNDPDLNACFIKSFEELRPYLKKGIPELDLPPGDPLHYVNLSATSGNDGAVKVHGDTWNQIATGLMDVEIKNISLDLDNAKCSASLFFPKLRMQGDYKFLGKILLFTIDTMGKYDINTTALRAKLDLDGKIYTKKSKQYLEFENVKLDYYMEKCKIYFSNLINGNPVLSDTVNKAVNDNIDSVIDELRPFLGGVYGAVAQQYFNKFFRMFPIDELFPRD